MKLLLSPQVPVDDTHRIQYKFDDDIIKVTLPDGTTDEYDFTNFTDGKLAEVESDLSTEVVLSAERKDGTLYVELLNYVEADADESELFPEWIDHTNYVPAKESEVRGEDDLEDERRADNGGSRGGEASTVTE